MNDRAKIIGFDPHKNGGLQSSPHGIQIELSH